MIEKISVIGAGTMGSGIAQVASSFGVAVTLVDSDFQALETSRAKLENILNRLLDKGKIDETASKKITNNIHWTSELSDVSNSELVIEAIIENLEIKQKLFMKLESLVSRKCILATNTSSLSVSEIASVCEHTQRVMGIHFFNPVPLMKLVEIIPTRDLASYILTEIQSTLEGWKKTVVRAKDTPGFIVNRVARPFYGEALKIFEEGIADFSTIDWAMKELGGFRMGPFELMDYIGNDVNYSATQAVYEGTGNDPRYAPSPIQKELVEKGYLGRKSGRGYFDYRNGSSFPEPQMDQELGILIFNRILAMLINEAAEALRLEIATCEDIDTSMTTGVNYPKGLLQWADGIGIELVLDQMKELQSNSNDLRYQPSPLLERMAKENTLFYS